MKVASLISKLGGVSAVAGALTKLSGKEVTTGTVYRWRDRETISYRWRPLMAELLASRGVKVPPELAMFAPRQAAE